MRIVLSESLSACDPSGLSRPGGTTFGNSGLSRLMDSGTYQLGLAVFSTILKMPRGVSLPSLPIPIGNVMTEDLRCLGKK
jgi:hypothetical protein